MAAAPITPLRNCALSATRGEGDAARRVAIASAAEARDEAEATRAVIARFHDMHMQLYAHNHPEKPLEFVSGRIAAIGAMAAVRCSARRPGRRGARSAKGETR